MQDIIHWDERLNVGSEVINNQHKVLFDLIKDLKYAIHTKVAKNLVDTIFSVLRDYTVAHFQREEEYLARHPHFSDHCLEHYRLLKILNSVIHDYRNNHTRDVENISDFLENWLREHIVDFDKQHLSKKNIEFVKLEEALEVDEFEMDGEARRKHTRIPHNDVVEGAIKAQIYNASRLRNGQGRIVDMSPGGLMLESPGSYRVDDLLLVSCGIGKNFKMEEKVKVRSVSGRRIGVQFVLPAEETVDFFTNLYGAVRLNRTRLE
jgi:hemerythrin